MLLPVIGISQNTMEQLILDCGVDGSITLYHLENDVWIYSDSSDAIRSTLPASTFKILNSAIALESGVISSENETLEWDGTENTFFGTRIDAWNEDASLTTAFKNSTVWYYVELAKRIGREQYTEYLNTVSYGNWDLSEDGHDFWNYGSFGVSPKNQIQFLKDFYLEKLPFSEKTYEIVKKLMISDETGDFLISGKTGWTKTVTEDIGWWIGYSENDKGTLFFATRITKDRSVNNPDFSDCRTSITKIILSDLEAIQ